MDADEILPVTPLLLALLPGLANNESFGENGPPPRKELHPLLLVLPPVLFGRWLLKLPTELFQWNVLGAESGPAGERRCTSMSNGEGISARVASFITVDDVVRMEIG